MNGYEKVLRSGFGAFAVLLLVLVIVSFYLNKIDRANAENARARSRAVLKLVSNDSLATAQRELILANQYRIMAKVDSLVEVLDRVP